MPDLPDFFVVGAMKSATTSLFHYVVQHPEVFEPADKEPAFFSSDGRPPAYTGPGDMRLIVGAVIGVAVFVVVYRIMSKWARQALAEHATQGAGPSPGEQS